jgi:organic radical activating enzyme
MTYHVGDVYEQGCQFGCGFCDKKFFQKIMEEEEVSESDGNWDLGRDED